jgi:hypothetical protein
MPRRSALAATLLLACASSAPTRPPAPSAVSLPREARAGEPTGFELPPSAALGERNRCIDRQLAVMDLNEYGDPQGTTYADGSPLEVSRGGDRYDYVLRHRRDVAVRCSRAPFEPSVR